MPRYGGLISSEWEFAKGLQLLEEDPEVYAATEHWVEAADWIVWRLCGRYLRNACTAGYKGIYQDGAYPSRGLPRRAQPRLRRLRRRQARTRDRGPGRRPPAASPPRPPPGPACPRASRSRSATSTRTSPPRPPTPSSPGVMTAIMGTSTCHVMNGEPPRRGPRACAGWSTAASSTACGDTRPASPASATSSAGSSTPRCRPTTSPRRRGSGATSTSTSPRWPPTQEVGEHGLVALDWHSGNRSVLVDHELSGLVVGQTLATRPEDTYRALLEATAFGTRTIVESFDESGVPVRELVVAGGLLKNALLMQIYADVTPAAAVDDRVGAGPRARLGHPRRRRRGRLPRRPDRRPGDGAPYHGRLPARRTARLALRRPVRRVPARSTTTSAAGATT